MCRALTACDLLSLAADKGYDDMSFRDELRSEGVRPLIKHRVFAPYDHAYNTRIKDDLTLLEPSERDRNDVQDQRL